MLREWFSPGAAVQSLSSEVTKVGFMCGKRPFPKRDELNGMLGDLMQHYSLMRDLFLVLPEEVGATVYNAVTGAVLSIMTALLAVITSLSDMSEKGLVCLRFTYKSWKVLIVRRIGCPHNGLNGTSK